jgi:hypothetical protein
LANAQKQAIQQAYDSSYSPRAMVLIEPEKRGLIKNSLSEIVTPIFSDNADIVIVGRTDDSMKTLPRMQEYTERAMNQFWRDLSGRDWDCCFAPRAWAFEVTPYFLGYGGGEETYRMFHMPIIKALKSGERVLPIHVDFEYPVEMIREEDGNLTYNTKRIDQLKKVTTFLKEAWEES